MDLYASSTLQHQLQPVVPQLQRLRRRRDLLASPLWSAHGAELERVASGIEYYRHPAPAPRPPRPFVRVAAWNIERGRRWEVVLQGLRDEPLQSADVIILNEVDIGMARSGQRNIARAAADALGMHYVFGNHYLCLDAGSARDGMVLGRDGAVEGPRAESTRAANTLGLHGNVILSRLPLLRAENVTLHETKDKFQSRSEKRFGVKKALWADVHAGGGTLTVAAVHLDSGTSPAGRARQLDDLLRRVDAVHPGGPLLVGGDWNTTTYDLRSPWALARNVMMKFLRGGFRHAVPHYMTPYLLYEKPVFQAVEAHGLDWRAFNDPDGATIVYDVDDPDMAHAVRQRVGALGVKLLRRWLAPWKGRAPLKVDWFAGRGCRPAHAAGAPARAAGALPPRALTGFRPGGRRASDHDPIVVDVELAT